MFKRLRKFCRDLTRAVGPCWSHRSARRMRSCTRSAMLCARLRQRLTFRGGWRSPAPMCAPCLLPRCSLSSRPSSRCGSRSWRRLRRNRREFCPECHARRRLRCDARRCVPLRVGLNWAPQWCVMTMPSEATPSPLKLRRATLSKADEALAKAAELGHNRVRQLDKCASRAYSTCVARGSRAGPQNGRGR